MTVSDTDTKASATGDGTAIAIPTEFVFQVAADLEVIERVIATGVETTKTLTTDYTVSGGGGAGAEPATGTVTAVATVPATVEWHVRRITAPTQGTDLPVAGAFPANSVEDMVDRLTLIVQNLQRDLDRALKRPATDSTALTNTIPNSVDIVSAFLAFDASGNVIASTGPTGDSSIPVTSYIETLLDDANAAAAQQTLDLEPGVDVQAFDADILKADVSDDLVVGYTSTSDDQGTVTTGTLTPAFADRNVQRYVNGGAHTLAPPLTGEGSMVVQMTNNGSAGALTTSGFTAVTGDALTTTNGDDFLFWITVVNAFSHLHVQAMQ